MCVHTGNLRQMHSILYTYLHMYFCGHTVCIYDGDYQLSTHAVATLVKLCSLFLGWANSTSPSPHTHTPRSLFLLLSVLLFLSSHTQTLTWTCKPRAQWSFSICMRFWIIYVLYCLIELCQVSLCAHLFLKPTKRASNQESEWEREWWGEGEQEKQVGSC